MKSNNKLAALLMSLTILSCLSCAAPFSWTRTTDHLDTETRTYYNESLNLKVSFPDGWKISAKPEASRYFPWTSEVEKETGVEVAMIAAHPSRLAYVSIAIEEAKLEGIVSSPIEYIEIVKENNYETFKASRQISLDEKVLNDVLVADWKYELFSEIGLTYRELVFLKYDFTCRIRCYANSSVYDKFKSTFEEIIQSVSLFYD
jgi:hypothetical protein